METLKPLPDTLQEAITHFADFENCRRFMIDLRWPDGKVACPRCGSKGVTWLAKARVWKCYAKHERPTFSLKTGTIFEDSPIALEKWLPAAWLLISCKNGISSYELGRALRVTQKSAWFMLQRLRLVLQDEETGGKLSGEVEIDETFIGGKARNMHRDRRDRTTGGYSGAVGKVAVMGMLERGGRVRTKVVRSTRRKNLNPEIEKHVEPGTSVFTDSLKSYDHLERDYVHQVIDHAVSYVNGNVHTNGMENFWSLLKRGLKGTYVSVDPFHLFRYLDEQAFRFNHRKLTDSERFAIAMMQIVGRRLTYDELTGKTEDSSSEIRS
jgi:transposase-like protein